MRPGLAVSEGIPITLYESAGCGAGRCWLSARSSRFRRYHDVYGRASVVRDRDKRQLGGAVPRLVGGDELRERMGPAAREGGIWVWTWVRSVEQAQGLLAPAPKSQHTSMDDSRANDPLAVTHTAVRRRRT